VVQSAAGAADAYERHAPTKGCSANSGAGSVDEIRKHAQFLIRVSYFSFALAVVVVVATCFSTIDVSEAKAERYWSNGLSIMTGFMAIGCWLYVVAQIIHIRANTQKEP
jgi:hypothetical protein